MSFPENIGFSQTARDDISEILRYTGQRWGNPQLRRYQLRLNRAVNFISEYPAIGREVDDCGRSCRAYSFGSHVIFYQQIEKRVVILRVLHQQMNHKDHL